MVQVETSGWAMVCIARPQSVREYEVFDTGGRRLGRVVEPVEPPAMGVGAATIMLHRGGGRTVA